MPLILSNYLISKELVDKLDLTYEIKMRKNLYYGDLLFKSDKIFLYANLLNILKLYNLNIDERIIKNIEIIKEKSITYIKNHDYNRELMMLMLNLITSVNIYEKTEPYFNYFKGYDANLLKRDIDYLYNLYEKTSYEPTKNNLTKVFDKAFDITFDILDFIKYILNIGPKIPVGDRIFEITLKEFKKILSMSNINKLNKKYTSYSYTKNTCVSESFIASPIYGEESYLDIIEEVKNISEKDCVDYLNKLLK